MIRRPIYDRRGWVLGVCTQCHRTNYVEPHGTTAACRCSPGWVEHVNVPYEARTWDTQRVLVGKDTRLTPAAPRLP